MQREQHNALPHSAAPRGVEPLLVRAEEAARILSLSRSMVYQLLDSGELASVRCGTARCIPVAVLRDWVAKRTQ